MNPPKFKPGDIIKIFSKDVAIFEKMENGFLFATCLIDSQDMGEEGAIIEYQVKDGDCELLTKFERILLGLED